MKNDETKKDRVGSLFRINSMRNTHMAKGECLIVCYAYTICAILRSEKATLLVLHRMYCNYFEDMFLFEILLKTRPLLSFDELG